MNTEQILEKIPKKQAPASESLRNVLLENDQVLVVETNYPIKGSVPMHTHRFHHVLYVIEGGTAEVTYADGTVSIVEIYPGQARWRTPQSLSTRNVGSTPLRIVEVEVKNASMGIAGERTPRVAMPAGLNWVQDTLDPKRKSALLSGDPTQPGPNTARFHVGAGYTIWLHQHPSEDENLTVLSGNLHWSTGVAGSGEPEHVLPVGSFLLFSAGTPYRLWTKEETELQMTGIGPRIYRYFNLSEDPQAKP